MSITFQILILWMICLPVIAKDYQLALNWKAEPQFGGFYEALNQGHYAKKGISLKILEGGSGTPTVQMLANGKVDFAVISAEELLISLDRNPQEPLLAVFATFQTNPQILMSHAERNFKSIGDIFSSEGILSIQSGLSFAQFLQKKYPNKKVQIVPYLGGVGSFLKDPKFSQQGFVSSEPLLAEKAGRKTNVFLIAKEGFNPYTTVVAVKKAFYANQEKVVRDFVLASRLGWENYQKDPSKTNQVMSLMNKAMDLDSFAKSAAAQKSLIEVPNEGPLGTMSLDRWKTLASQLQELSSLKKVPTNLDCFVNIQ